MTGVLLKLLPYSIFSRVYYRYFKSKKLGFSNFLTQKKGYKSLASIDLSKHKKSEKLFVIGSGQSLNNISSNQWKEINQHDTFGFNFSFINDDHIPTFYSFEAVKPTDLNKFGRSFVGELFFQLFKNKKDAYKNVIKFVTDLEKDRVNHFENFAMHLFDENFYILNTVNCIANSTARFSKVLNFYKNKGIFEKKDHLEEIFKFRATLSMALSLGINLGYKEIILCGIDLSDPTYFYEDKIKYPHIPNFRSSNNTVKHATLVGGKFQIPVDLIVKEMYNSICIPKDIKVFIQNPNSALNNILPKYFFNS